MRNSIYSSSKTFDVIVLVETFLNDDYPVTEIKLNNYNIYRQDRNPLTSPFKLGGRVLIAVHESILSNQITDVSNNIEHVFVHLTDAKVVIGTAYIPPWSNSAAYVTHSVDICKLRDAYSDASFVIVGDYNLPEVEWTDGFSYIERYRGSQLLSDLAYLNFCQFNGIVNINGVLLKSQSVC